MKLAAALFLTLLLSPIAAHASEWETIRDCQLIENPSNDGDSFHVLADGVERIFRLYFVDTPESKVGGLVAERVKKQAAEFGLTEEETAQIGIKAAAFTKAVLSRPFTVLTRGQNALGHSKLKREYAFIKTADGDDLGKILLEHGLARSHGQVAAPPGKTVANLRSNYDRLESRAKADKVGAWGSDADKPTLALPEPEQKP